MIKLITVIIPVYNVEGYIRQCIDSVLGQTYTELEVILVDDGSTDCSGIICDEYACKDARIKVIHKENGGLSSARNVALDIATGEYIAFVDSDDYLALDTFEKCYAKLLQTDADVCMFSHYTTNGETCTAHRLPFEKEVYTGEDVKNKVFPKFFGKTSNDLEVEGFVCRQIFKRDVIGELRFRSEREYFAEDVVFDIELYSKVSRFCVINEPLYYYRYVSSSLSNKYRDKLFEKLNNLLVFMAERAKGQSGDLYNRVLGRAFTFAKFACLNVKKGDMLSRKEQISLIREIAENIYVRESINIIKRSSLKEKVFAFLLKKKAARLILALI